MREGIKKIFLTLIFSAALSQIIFIGAAEALPCCKCAKIDIRGNGSILGYEYDTGITDRTACVNKSREPAYVCEISDCVATEPIQDQNIKFGEIKPQIKIPGLIFSALPTEIDENGNIRFPWIGEYIKAIYSFGLVALSILAVVVIIMQGAKVITSAGGSAKEEAYKAIAQAVIGLLIGWGSYVILATLNTNLTQFNPVAVRFVPQIAEYESTVSVGTANNDMGAGAVSPEYKTIIEQTAAGLGINACLLAKQIGLESNWNPNARTACCYGLGQINKKNARSILTTANKRQQFLSLYGGTCDKCPALSASDDDIATWLTQDTKANIIMAAMIRKNGLDGTNNPLAAAAVYGMGIGTYNDYIKKSGCAPTAFDETAFLNQLKTGANPNDLIKSACVPPDIWPLPKTDMDCPGSNACCRASSGPCERPVFSDSGRRGICQGGDRDGKSCYAVAGGETYIKHYIDIIRDCAQ